MPNNRTMVLFVRVPKTATTLLHCIVENTLGKEAVLLFDCYDARSAAEAIVAGHRSQTWLASAHMPYGAHRHLNWDCEYVTLLRDPVDRVVSLYHHVQMPHLSGVNWLHREGMSLDDWVSWQRDCGANTCNTAVRYLSGLAVDNGSEQRFDRIETRHLELAKSNLVDHFPVVGVMDRFEPFLRRFEARHGLSPHGMGHVNGRRGAPPYGERPTDRQNLPKATVDAIDADNELDLELYRFVEREIAV